MSSPQALATVALDAVAAVGAAQEYASGPRPEAAQENRQTQNEPVPTRQCTVALAKSPGCPGLLLLLLGGLLRRNPSGRGLVASTTRATQPHLPPWRKPCLPTTAKRPEGLPPPVWPGPPPGVTQSQAGAAASASAAAPAEAAHGSSGGIIGDQAEMATATSAVLKGYSGTTPRSKVNIISIRTTRKSLRKLPQPVDLGSPAAGGAPRPRCRSATAGAAGAAAAVLGAAVGEPVVQQLVRGWRGRSCRRNGCWRCSCCWAAVNTADVVAASAGASAGVPDAVPSAMLWGLCGRRGGASAAVPDAVLPFLWCCVAVVGVAGATAVVPGATVGVPVAGRRVHSMLAHRIRAPVALARRAEVGMVG